MKNISLVLYILFLLGCSKNTENYDLCVSNIDYRLNIETGEFQIDWYKNYKSRIRFDKN